MFAMPDENAARILAGYEQTQSPKKRSPKVTSVVIEVRGYKSTVKREMERRMAREFAEAKKLGLKQIGFYPMPGLPWDIQRPVFHAPGMSRRHFKVISPSVMLHKWEREFERFPSDEVIQQATSQIAILIPESV